MSLFGTAISGSGLHHPSIFLIFDQPSTDVHDRYLGHKFSQIGPLLCWVEKPRFAYAANKLTVAGLFWLLIVCFAVPVGDAHSVFL